MLFQTRRRIHQRSNHQNLGQGILVSTFEGHHLHEMIKAVYRLGSMALINLFDNKRGNMEERLADHHIGIQIAGP